LRFRRLARRDYPLLVRWLEEPLVVRWWDHQTSPDALERDFGVTIDEVEPTEVFVAMLDGSPFGLIQRYLIGSYQEYLDELNTVCAAPGTALSVDYLIGEPDHRGRGLGAAMIAAMVAESWSAFADAPAVIVAVHASNIASWRALERAGFRRIAEGALEPDNPIDSRDHFIYRIDRPAAQR